MIILPRAHWCIAVGSARWCIAVLCGAEASSGFHRLTALAPGQSGLSLSRCRKEEASESRTSFLSRWIGISRRYGALCPNLPADPVQVKALEALGVFMKACVTLVATHSG